MIRFFKYLTIFMIFLSFPIEKSCFARDQDLKGMLNLRVNAIQKVSLGATVQVSNVFLQIAPGIDADKMSLGFGGATENLFWYVFRPIGGGIKASILREKEEKDHSRKELIGLELGFCYGTCIEVGYFKNRSKGSESLILVALGIGH